MEYYYASSSLPRPRLVCCHSLRHIQGFTNTLQHMSPVSNQSIFLNPSWRKRSQLLPDKEFMLAFTASVELSWLVCLVSLNCEEIYRGITCDMYAVTQSMRCQHVLLFKNMNIWLSRACKNCWRLNLNLMHAWKLASFHNAYEQEGSRLTKPRSLVQV
jgi:hypothetical protein